MWLAKTTNSEQSGWQWPVRIYTKDSQFASFRKTCEVDQRAETLIANARGLRGSDLFCYTTSQDTRVGAFVFVKSKSVSDKKGPMACVDDLCVCERRPILLVILCSVGRIWAFSHPCHASLHAVCSRSAATRSRAKSWRQPCRGMTLELCLACLTSSVLSTLDLWLFQVWIGAFFETW